MKTTISNKSKTQFPKLQKGINGNIYLMCTPQSGTCVFDTLNSWHRPGQYYTNLDPKDFTDFDDAILLEN